MSLPVKDALLAYAHFIMIIATASILAVELALCRGDLTLDQARRLSRVDLAYFGFAMLLLASGLARLFLGIKGSGFYLSNPVFHLKMGLFILVGLLSIVPTMRFIAWRRRLAGA